MRKIRGNAADVQELAAQEESTGTGMMSNMQVNNEVETTSNPEDSSQTWDKDFFKELLWKQPTRELTVIMIDLLRDIWDFYDETYLYATFGMTDERVEFLKESFLDPLYSATDEVSEEIGYESGKDHFHHRLAQILGQKAKGEIYEEDDRLPF